MEEKKRIPRKRQQIKQTKPLKLKKEPIFIGIDPGKGGAIAAIDKDLEVLDVNDWPGNELLCSGVIKEYCQWWNNDQFKIFAALEKVHAMPGQGVTSMFTFGENYGMWKMALAYAGLSYLNPPPQTWMKGMVVKKQFAGDSNKAHLAAACQLFPEYKHHFIGPRGGIKTDRCAAVLIAYWRRQQYFKGE